MKIGFLGAGHLGKAIITGLLNSKKFQKEDFKLVVASDSSLKSYQQENFLVSQDWDFIKDCKIIILALLPNDIKKLATKLEETFTIQHIIISVAAGVSLIQLQKIFPNSLVTRAMPNTSCQFNQSMTMITKEANQQANNKAIEIFNLLGTTVLLSEDKIHVFIAICGSASAYLYYWMQPLMQLALDSGFSLEESKTIIANLLIGSAANINHGSLTLAQLQQQVSVPGGTTVEAIQVFDQNNFKDIIKKAILAVVKKSEALE